MVGKLNRPASGIPSLQPKPTPGQAVRNQRRWKALSRWYRATNRRCERCSENLSDEVHHRIAVADAPHLAFAPSNLMALCRGCHAAIHGKRSRFAPIGPEAFEPKPPPPAASPPRPPQAAPCRSMYEPSFIVEPVSMYERGLGVG